MVDYDTFLITLYVQAHDFCKVHPLASEETPLWPCGRRRALSRSEVLTLSVLGQWYRYRSERDFSGPHLHRLWEAALRICVVGAPQAGHGTPWPPEQERWVARLRQIVETVHEKLLNFFRVSTERPHALRGLFARLSAKVALHNFCIWMNRQLGRPDLAFATLLGWT